MTIEEPAETAPATVSIEVPMSQPAADRSPQRGRAAAAQRLGLGLTAQRTGHVELARRFLDEAVRLAVGAGDAVLAARAALALGALPHRPAPPEVPPRVADRSGGPAELTAREREITALVVRGDTNRDVAAELAISTKTVEFHLGNVFGKLGVANRYELRRRLRAVRPDPGSEVRPPPRRP